MIHRVLTWMLLILAPEAVEGRFLASVLASMAVGRCGRPTSKPWDEPPSLGDAQDALGMTVVAVDRSERWTH
jgi:TfoX/Sxy family transcriptional regulator of competence genes